MAIHCNRACSLLKRDMLARSRDIKKVRQNGFGRRPAAGASTDDSLERSILAEDLQSIPLTPQLAENAVFSKFLEPHRCSDYTLTHGGAPDLS